MEFVDILVKKMIEDDDLFKAISAEKGVKMMLDWMREAKDPKTSKGRKQQLMEKLAHMRDTGQELKDPKAKGTAGKKMNALEQAVADSKEKRSAAAGSSLARQAGIKDVEEKFTADQSKAPKGDNKIMREKARALGIKLPTEKEPGITPGSAATLAEIKASANRARRDPKAPLEVAIKPMEQSISETIGKNPEKAKRMMTAHVANKSKDALNEFHKQLDAGDIETAHTLFHHIPKNHLPDGLQDYNPAYAHYGSTPEIWKQTMPDSKQAIHDLHKQVVSGALNDHPDWKDIAPKVQALKMPKVTA